MMYILLRSFRHDKNNFINTFPDWTRTCHVSWIKNGAKKTRKLPRGNNNLNFRLAPDQAVHLDETAANSRMPADVKQILQFIICSIFEGQNNLNTEGLIETNLIVSLEVSH